MQTLTGHRGRVRSLSFSPDGRFLASAAGHGLTISLWDLHHRGRRRYLKGHQQRVAAVCFIPSGGLLCSLESFGVVKGWDYQRGEVVWQASVTPAYDATFAPDPRGRFLAVASGHLGYPGTYSVALHPLPDQLHPQPDEIIGPPTPDRRPAALRCLACGPDGGMLAVGRTGQTVILHEQATGNVLASLDHTGGVHSLAFSPDGLTLAVAAGSHVVLWDTATHQRQAVLRRHTRSVTGVAFTPDGRQVASAGLDGHVRLWDARGGERAVFDWDIGPLHSLALAADGLRGACGSDSGAIVLWDLDP